MSEIPDRIMDEARELAHAAWLRPDVIEVIAQALLAAGQRGRDEGLATIVAVHDILRADDRYGALAHLPAGGIECEEMVEKAVDLLAAAIRSRTEG